MLSERLMLFLQTEVEPFVLRAFAEVSTGPVGTWWRVSCASLRRNFLKLGRFGFVRTATGFVRLMGVGTVCILMIGALIWTVFITIVLQAFWFPGGFNIMEGWLLLVAFAGAGWILFGSQ
jgi:hypothetical protein